MRQFMMAVMALAVFGPMPAAQAETASPDQVPYSDWATGADYQKLFNAMVRQQRYPRVVEARAFNGIVLYRAAFEPYPGPGCPGPECTFHFWSHHGITPDLPGPEVIDMHATFPNPGRFNERDTQIGRAHV